MPGIEELMDALESDKTLKDNLSASSTPEEAVIVAKNAGYTISKGELLEAYKAKMASMSEEELDNVSGGKGNNNYYQSQQNDNSGQGGQSQG